MKIIVNYTIQGENNQSYNSEMLDLNLVPPLYSPSPHQADIDKEIIRWAEQKQKKLPQGEKVIILNTLYT